MGEALEKTPEENSKEANTRRLALIGLLATLLTVCGTLTGALIGGGTTIYKAARSAEQLEIPASDGEQSLSVDTGELNITASDMDDFDPQKYLKFPVLGFIMEKPLPGWTDRGAMTYADLFTEPAVNLSPLIFYYSSVGVAWDDQTVRQLRFDEPVMVTYLTGSTENGYPASPDDLEFDTVAFYSQMTVLVLDRQLLAPDYNLYNLSLQWGSLHWGAVNTLIANEGSPYVFEQVSWQVNGVEVDGGLTDLTLERWALFIQGDLYDYIVEIQYVPGQSARVWDELQEYIREFRVID